MRSASRKYIDLVYKASAKFANWDPSKRIQVGDYGTIDRETGSFEKEGNIYNGDFIPEYTCEDDATLGKPLDEWHTSSNVVKCREFSAGPEMNVAGFADIALTGQWEFGRKRAALLVMYRPRLSHIPGSRLVKRLSTNSELKGMVLVTEVYSCPAFISYLSSKNRIATGGGLHGAWSSRNATGTYQAAGSVSGSENDYTPLYHLKSIRKGWLGSRGAGADDPEFDGDDLWVESDIPWGDLDEDGEEEGD